MRKLIVHRTDGADNVILNVSKDYTYFDCYNGSVTINAFEGMYMFNWNCVSYIELLPESKS